MWSRCWDSEATPARGPIAESIDNPGGGLHAEVAGEQDRFELFESLLVDHAGERGDAFKLGGEGFAGAGDRVFHAIEADGLAHAPEEAPALFAFLFLRLGFFRFFVPE